MDSKLPTGQSLIGTHLGKYRIVEEVGMGGMSIVYRAIDEVLDREVAVKLLHSHLSRRSEARQRFHREARAVAKLRHPNIVEIYDFSSQESRHSFIVTEFIRGPTLREFVEGRGIHLPELGAMIVIQVADALSHAHQLGVIHRDVKPENVMIRPDGVVKLMDFGIAHVQDAQKMTQTGSLLGSPAHMPPEAIAGEETDHRGDLFSLGTVLYFAATGSLPFTGRNPAAVLRAITECSYLDPQIRDPRIGQKLASIIRRSLARRPEERYQSAREMAEDLREAVFEVGLSQVTTELRQYLTAPDEYETVLLQQAVDALDQRGREAFDRREVARAVDCFNRILAIDESHEGARQALARLDRRRRWIGVVLALVLALAAIGGGLLFAGLFEQVPDPIPNNGMAMAVPPDQPDGEPSGEAGEVPAPGSSLQQVWQQFVSSMEPSTTGTEASSLVSLAAIGQDLRESVRRTAALVTPSGDPTPTGPQAGESADAGGSETDADRQQAEPALSPDPDTGDVPAEQPERMARNQENNGRSSTGERRDPEQTTNTGTQPGPESVAAVQPSPVRVLLHPPFPPTLHLSIDGEEFSSWENHTDGILLTPGIHRIHYRDPRDNVVPQTFRIEVPNDTEVYQVPERHICPWRDATLVVDSDLLANVIVDGTLAGRSGQTIHIPITEPYGRQVFEVEVIPDEEWGRTHREQLSLEAASTRQLQVRLRRP
ncbi:MAG: protein kinase [Bradymonadales bacterium]|nr:protein kinase [Bradymonadales bacterium]